MRFAAPLSHELDPSLQHIEIATFFQIPSFQIIGLPSPEVCEARERIRAAIDASGFDFPRRRVVINLSPASVRKRGTGIDLAMALAVMESAQEKPTRQANEGDDELTVAWAELGLGGELRSAGQITRAVYAAWQARASRLILPISDLEEARERRGWILESGRMGDLSPPTVHGVGTLAEAWARLREAPPLEDSLGIRFGTAPSRDIPPAKAASPGTLPENPEAQLLPLAPALERILGLSAAGAHHLLLLGPKGAGKTHALEWISALRPDAAPEIRVRRQLLAELGENTGPQERSQPIRWVGAQTRPGALLGHLGQGTIRPGEFTLAHGGLLIADELPEWARDSREALREPLERSSVTLSRASGSLELPARFTLAATGNLCPCGGWPPQIPNPSGKKVSRCRCGDASRRHYLARLSGPVLDRIDLFVLLGWELAESNGARDASLNRLKDCVHSTRENLRVRWGNIPGQLDGADLEAILREHADWRDELARLAAMSARSRHKILRVALTLAAWEGREGPRTEDFLEASFYRPERHGLCQ